VTEVGLTVAATSASAEAMTAGGLIAASPELIRLVDVFEISSSLYVLLINIDGPTFLFLVETSSFKL
jgi:hypothetical protein